MSTKIVVVKLRDVVKKAILAFIGLVILGLIFYFFIPKSDTPQALYNAGTYSAEIILHNNSVLVEVTVSNDEILDIQLLNMGEVQEVFYPLFGRSIDEVASQVINNQSTFVTSSTDNSVTTQILVDAIDKALEEAQR